MSELKKGMELTPIKIMLKQPNTDGKVYPVPCLVYIKSEADKVIAELKDDCAYWKTMSRKCADDNEVMAKQRAEAFKRERRQKYKRCLAMAWWCSAELGMLVSTWEFKIKHYKKWQKRWLELAEKFKEAK